MYIWTFYYVPSMSGSFWQQASLLNIALHIVLLIVEEIPLHFVSELIFLKPEITCSIIFGL